MSKHLFDENTEKSLLGCFMLDKEQIDICLTITKEEHFYKENHKDIFRAIMSLYNADVAIDFTTLSMEVLKFSENVKPAEIILLEQFVFGTVNAPDYAKILLEKYNLREIVRTCADVIDSVNSGTLDSETAKIGMDSRLAGLQTTNNEKNFKTIGEISVDVAEEIRNTDSSKGSVMSGFFDLDRMTGGGFPNSDLVIIAARPSVGKTAFAMNIALNVGLMAKEKKPVAIFSLEMSAEQVTSRIISTRTGIPMSAMRLKDLTKDQNERLNQCLRDLHDARIYIDDESSLTITKLRNKARRLKSKQPDLSLIIVDYLQLMTGDKQRISNRQEDISEISRGLKALARELNVPVIALSQLNRDIEKRAGKKATPMLSDLRESGAIEQDADTILFLHREKKIEKSDPDQEEKSVSTAELIIGKQRNGAIGIIDLIFIHKTATYRSIKRVIEDELQFLQ